MAAPLGAAACLGLYRTAPILSNGIPAFRSPLASPFPFGDGASLSAMAELLVWGMQRFGSIGRRTFLKGVALALPSTWPLSHLLGRSQTEPVSAPAKHSGHELSADLVVVGGGLGGCAAALAAARSGLRVVMTEETDWIGGQLTSQAVPPDENPWIESFGGTLSYLQLRQRIRDYYLRNYPLSAEARSKPFLNPGNGFVSRLCCEPRVALAALNELLAPFSSGGRLRVLLQHKPVEAFVDGDIVKAVRLLDFESGNKVVLSAPFFIDATELGDLLALTKTEHFSGSESRKQTGEPHASTEEKPANQQAFTCCFAMDFLAGEDHTIQKPEDYGFWRDYVPNLKPAWPGRLLDWTYSDPITLTSKKLETDPEKATGLWAYRRIADKNQFTPGSYPGDISLVNWPQNDYLLGNLCGVSETEAELHLRAAKHLSLSLLYWLQTDAPRPDGGTGWKGLRLRPDVVGTSDGLAKQPYIRESRRIRAEFTILEQHVSTEIRAQEMKVPASEAKAAEFPDSVGIGSYRIDLHPTTGGENYLDISSLPFQIPLGALLPSRVENLLPASKNIGTTHITNGCYRLHPVEWNIGESVGLLVSFCRSQRMKPRQVRANTKALREFQNRLLAEGVPLNWPRITPR